MYLMNDCTPCSVSGFSGRGPEFRQIADFVRNYKGGALLVHGQTGSGKTDFVHKLAKDMGLEILELNASDMRNKEALLKTAKNAAMQMSLFSDGKIILIDEVDALSGTDRGAVSAIADIIKETKWPIILTANDEMNERVHDLKKKCRFMELPPPTHNEMVGILKEACTKNSVCFEESALQMLARQSDGDVRASLIDLYVASFAGSIKDVSGLSGRMRNRDVSESMKIIFNTSDPQIAVSAFDNTDMQLNDCMMWVEENMPKEYSGVELSAGYDALSKADVFLGRIRRWQHWRFLVYANALLTAGIALSKSSSHRKAGDVKYARSSRPLKYWIMNAKNGKKKAIAEKLAKACHTSKRKALKSMMPYFRLQFSNNPKAISEELKLEEDEAEWITD